MFVHLFFFKVVANVLTITGLWRGMDARSNSGGDFHTHLSLTWVTKCICACRRFQVSHGLSALHDRGGIHRNINAGNIYLDEKRRARLGGYCFLKVYRYLVDEILYHAYPSSTRLVLDVDAPSSMESIAIPPNKQLPIRRLQRSLRAGNGLETTRQDESINRSVKYRGKSSVPSTRQK